MKRAALYVRVSTQEQKLHGTSVDSQIDALKAFCADNGYIVAGIYNDAGISARKRYKHRPALLSLMDDCKMGKVDVILFTKLDRWFRSVADYYEVQSILDGCKVPWRAIWEDYETETSAGVFKVNIMLSIAQAEVDRTSERVKAVNEYRKAQGVYISGRAAEGYKVVQGTIIKDKETEEIVKGFFDLYLRTLSVRDATMYLHKHGLNKGRQAVRNMLGNEMYTGNAYGCTFEPYLTAEQFKTIKDELERTKRTKTPRRDKTYLYTGICKCAMCGGNMAAKTRKIACGGVVRPYIYYNCSRHDNLNCENNRSITEGTIEKYLMKNLSSLLDDYNFSISASKPVASDVESKIKSLEQRLQRIGERFEDGDITREEYREKRDLIKAEIAQLNDIIFPIKPIEMPETWKEMYLQLDDDHKRAFWHKIIKRIDVNKGKDSLIKIYF